jgi:UDP-N-acetylmuramoyl-tripeptide--D-alanyl-D-alanine ligase
MARLTLDEIARATRGALEFGAGAPARGGQQVMQGYSIDSRSVGPGDLFFALVGPRHDAHRFVEEAARRGAAAAVVSKGARADYPATPALVRVQDTTRALQDLGAHVRRRRPLTVVGITGSAGKTTAKEMTAAVLSGAGPTFKSEGNLNNTYGLPLVLLRMPEESRTAVLEMGMSYQGEIARLVEIADPDVGVILNVLPVHLEHFGSLAAIARAKGEMFAGLRRDAVAVYNADDPHAARLGRAFPGRRVAFGLGAGAEVTAEEIATEAIDSTRFTLVHGAARLPVRIALAGRHNVGNALAAAAVGFTLGLDADAVRRGLETVRPAAMRGVVHRLADGTVLLDDSYNSNPAAMERAIETLRSAAAGRRVLVAGDMLELGPTEAAAHARVGEQAAAAGIDLLVAVGPLSRRAHDAARAAGRDTLHFDDSEQAAAWAATGIRPGDLVLVKGSRGIRMERVVQAILAARGTH